MLKNSFIHLHDIGPTRESKLWQLGASDWDKFLSATPRELNLSEGKYNYFKKQLLESKKRLAEGNADYFAKQLPAKERFRIASSFSSRLAYIDIETTGQGAYSDITTIGVYADGRAKVFVRGINLDEFPTATEHHDIFVTYNGASFDVPFLRREFGDSFEMAANIDLRYVLGALGYKGGLKLVEKKLGLSRPTELQGVDGFEAVLLWQRWKNRENTAALSKLIRYNLEDIVNLEPLLERAAEIAHRKYPDLTAALKQNNEKLKPFASNNSQTSRKNAAKEAHEQLGILAGLW